MTTMAEMEERMGTLEAQLQQALERSMRHGQEHWIEGSDPAAIRWQTGSGAPTHEAEEGTPYWDTAGNKGHVNSNGGSAWEALGSAGAGGAHTMASDTHTDTANVVANTGDLLQIQTGIWIPRPASNHGNHPTAASIADADKYEIYLSFGSEREVFSPV